MATTKEQWQTAFDILDQFERKLIGPEEFKWEYFVEHVDAGKSTLWRNPDFKSEFQRVQRLIKQYRKTTVEYSIERSVKGQLEHEIIELKARIKELENERDRDRERLAYAAMVARRKGIDPEEFCESSPLLRAIKAKKKECKT